MSHLGAQGLCRKVVEVPVLADLVLQGKSFQLRTLMPADTSVLSAEAPPLSARV